MDTNRIDAKFEKVSYKQFRKDVLDNMVKLFGHTINELYIDMFYDNITLPKRATKGSAGYDFFFPFPTRTIPSGTSIYIPTGIKCKMPETWWLGLFPKSSFGIKYRVKMDDTISVIDSDYYNCEKNEGHICVVLRNNNVGNVNTLKLEQNMSYCQGIFLPYGITMDDDTTAIRTGGLGSTQAKTGEL